MKKAHQLILTLFISILIGLGIMFIVSSDDAQASISDGPCSTWSDISKDCNNTIPTNCGCDVVVEP